jgi:hypothetical protein
MGRLPIYGKTSHTWEDFPYVGSAIHAKSSHSMEVFLQMGSLPIDGKVSHTWEVFLHVYIHIYLSIYLCIYIYIYIWEGFPFMGRLAICGKTSQ